MKRVCFAVTDALSLNSLCKGQLEYFRDAGKYDISLLCSGSEDDIEIIRSRGFDKVYRVPISRKPSIAKDIYALVLCSWFFIRHRFDLVVYSTPKAMLLCAIASCIGGQRKRVALVRGRAYENFSGLKRRVYEIFDRVAFLCSTSVLFISHSLLDAYVYDGIISYDKADVLGSGSSNGVDMERFYPDKDKSFQGVMRVVSVGRACLDKGVLDFSKVVSKVTAINPLIEFVWVGTIEDAASKVLLEELSKNVSFRHEPHSNDVAKFFRLSDLHLFLSHREGFGNVAIEAAASGIPTFSYDVVGVRDSVSNGVSGVRFPFGDIEGITKAILDYYSDLSRGSFPFSGSREWVEGRFSQEAVWRQYLGYYNSIIRRE